jgi:hypothetical protein
VPARSCYVARKITIQLVGGDCRDERGRAWILVARGARRGHVSPPDGDPHLQRLSEPHHICCRHGSWRAVGGRGRAADPLCARERRGGRRRARRPRRDARAQPPRGHGRCIQHAPRRHRTSPGPPPSLRPRPSSAPRARGHKSRSSPGCARAASAHAAEHAAPAPGRTADPAAGRLARELRSNLGRSSASTGACTTTTATTGATAAATAARGAPGATTAAGALTTAEEARTARLARRSGIRTRCGRFSRARGTKRARARGARARCSRWQRAAWWCAPPPPPPFCTNWTRLVPPSVLTGHGSSLLPSGARTRLA